MKIGSSSIDPKTVNDPVLHRAGRPAGAAPATAAGGEQVAVSAADAAALLAPRQGA